MAGRDRGPLDPLEELLITGRRPRATGTTRVARALAGFDAATIATTHEFCLRMLDGLGVLGDREPQAVFVDQITDLTREVATDLYLQRYAPTGQPPMELRRGGQAGRGGRQRRAHPPGPGTRRTRRPVDRRRAGRVRRRGPRRGGPAEAAPAAVHLRRHAHPAARRARRPTARRRGRPATPGSLSGGARRRVPGHRPDPVGDHPPRLPRAHHADHDRRPEAGHLRVPRRRRLQLPGRGPAGRSGPDARHQLAQRRRPGGRAGRPLGRRAARRRTDRGPPGARPSRSAAG